MPDRYLTPQQFGARAAELRLVDQPGQDAMLEFLERQEILPPAARVRFPLAIVIEGRDGQANPVPTPDERAASEALVQALDGWARHDADPELDHPLDRPGSQAWSGLVARPGEVPFEDWSTFGTNVRRPGERAFVVPDRVRTYYHGWQALLLADALSMGLQLVFDTRDETLMRQALTDHRSLPDDAAHVMVRFDAPRGLAQGMIWARHLDATARFETVRERAEAAVSRQHLDGSDISITEQNDYRAILDRAAGALTAAGGDEASWIAFLRYVCERWDSWRRKGRPELANEYQRHIQTACALVMRARRREFADLAVQVGRVGGHFTNILDVIFPDRRLAAREKVQRSMVGAVVAKAPHVPADLTLQADDVVDLLDWLERKGEWKLHLHIEAILERQFKPDAMDHAALAKEVESIANTVEHLLNELLADAGLPATRTLAPKLLRFWTGAPRVRETLLAHLALTSTKPRAPREHRVLEINRLTLAPDQEIARVLMLAVLYRNVGSHSAMRSWSEPELHEVSRVLLTAILFCRKALTAGYRPVPEVAPVPTAIQRWRARAGSWIKALGGWVAG